MRRKVLFALLALALPTAALANSMPLFETGTFASGEILRIGGGGLLQANFHSSITGSTAQISLSNITLIPPISGSACTGNVPPFGTCTFNSGTVTVRDPTTLMTLFIGSLVNGHVSKTSLAADITADVIPVSRIFPTEHFVKFIATFPEVPDGSLLLGSRATVSASVIPEPGTLCLFGTSVFVFAGIARYRLKLGR